MVDAMCLEKISEVSRTRGRPQVPVKWQVLLLKMGNYLFNGGWKRLGVQARLEYAIEEIVRDTRLEPEDASIVVEFCLGKAAKERTVGNQIGIKSQWNRDGRKILQGDTHLLIDGPSWVEFISNGMWPSQGVRQSEFCLCRLGRKCLLVI